MRAAFASSVAVAAALVATSALPASEHTADCFNTGAGAPEPIGDRAGHMLVVSAGTCVETIGSFEGMVTTQNTLWEHDSTGSKVLSGDGVARKPGTLLAYRLLEATLTPVMKDGKQVGWTARGKGVYTLGTGDAAAMTGKTFSWTSKPVGPRRYSILTVVDD